MNVREYVLQQLCSYNQLHKEIEILEFELKSLAPFNESATDDLIESMTFAHSSEDAVQNNHISDKTAMVALNYHQFALEQSRDSMQ